MISGETKGGTVVYLHLRTPSLLGRVKSRISKELSGVSVTSSDSFLELMGEVLLQSLLGGILGIAAGYGISYLLGFLSIPITTPWEVNLMPAFAKHAETAAAAVRLPVTVSAGLTSAALALSLGSGALASYFMGRRTARMKPVDILRRL